MDQDDSTRQEAEQQPLAIRKEPKKRNGVIVLALLFLVAAVAAGAFGWLWYQQNDQVARLKEQVKSRDQEVKRLYAVSSAVQKEKSSNETDDENDAIIAASLAAARAPKEATDMSYESTIKYNKSGFARTSVRSDDMSGFAQVLKLVNDQWVVIVSGQDKPSQDDVTRYGIPQAVIDSY